MMPKGDNINKRARSPAMKRAVAEKDGEAALEPQGLSDNIDESIERKQGYEGTTWILMM